MYVYVSVNFKMWFSVCKKNTDIEFIIYIYYFIVFRPFYFVIEWQFDPCLTIPIRIL